MRYAIKENKKVEPQFSGERAFCPICKNKVVGKIYSIRINHWAHLVKSESDCDSWYEPITEWHLNWQNLFPEENREVTITENNISHRADILLNNELVIEFQNSPIKIREVERRETFYNKNNRKLIWVLNGKSLAESVIVEKENVISDILVSISIPKSFPLVKNYSSRRILKHKLIGFLNADKKRSEIKENILTFKYTKEEFEIEHIKDQYKNHIIAIYKDLYGEIELNEFKKLIKIEDHLIEETFIKPRLKRLTWRAFIDKMESPVFIDNLKGLEEDELYYLSENKIISKEKFIKKALTYV
ncbi:competence protein CoiA [Sinomicrobium oceani]|uniref:competence protein CoiA n=1 Tax=Sinomicrobium oceani TaxID=1150368 RepID=UPI00227CCB14|nr:competence protein CoiA family protein [Sinomicrobium oceani]